MLGVVICLTTDLWYANRLLLSIYRQELMTTSGEGVEYFDPPPHWEKRLHGRGEDAPQRTEVGGGKVAAPPMIYVIPPPDHHPGGNPGESGKEDPNGLKKEKNRPQKNCLFF